MLEAVSIAVFAEALYSAAISGCYGAVVQKLRRAHPLWASGVLILVILPGLLLWFDYLLHLYTGMSNLKGGMLARREPVRAFVALQLVPDEPG